MSAQNSASMDARNELVELVKERTEIAKTLANLERQIYAFEGSYINDTQPYGNVMRGWDRYFSRNRGSGKSGQHSQYVNRMFSRSSVTSMAAVNEMAKPGPAKAKPESDTDSDSDSDSDDESSDANTVLPSTSRGYSSAKSSKKHCVSFEKPIAAVRKAAGKQKSVCYGAKKYSRQQEKYRALNSP